MSISTLNLSGKLLELNTPKIMGILNITPDSFFDGGKYKNNVEILDQANKMIGDGAAIIDIGGSSSRPNAQPVSEREEMSRILPIVQLLRKNIQNITISVDTYRSSVAAAALSEGATMINDISGGELDTKMYEVVNKFKASYVLMHMQGTPQNMNYKTNYSDLLTEVMDYFIRKIDLLHTMGIHDIIIDPGFGFAKNIEQNYKLLKNLSYFNCLNNPIMVGISRKSMIYKLLQTTPQEALNGTTALHTIALIQGAKILRVHDVKEANEVIKLVQNTYKI